MAANSTTPRSIAMVSLLLNARRDPPTARVARQWRRRIHRSPLQAIEMACECGGLLAGHVLGPVERLHFYAYRDRRMGRDPGGDFQCAVHQPLRLDDLVDEVIAQGLFGVERLARQGEPESGDMRDLPAEPRRAAGARHSVGDLGQSERRAGYRDPNVGQPEEVDHALAQHRTVDRADDGFEPLLAEPEDLRLPPRILAGLFVSLRMEMA